MAEYIDREAAEDAVGEAYLKGLNPLRELRDVPTADVVPVVHGWWNADENCSVCGENSTEGLDATKWNYWLPNYCPLCGAKMDGGADNAAD